MPFVKVSKSDRAKMYRVGGFRERSIMKNAKFVTNYALGQKDCIKFHDTKNGKTAVYSKKRGRWVN